MANELKFGNKVIFANGNPILLPSGTSDPGSATAGDFFYRTDTTRVRYYNGTIWQNVAFGDVITAHSGLTGLTSGDDHTQYALLAGRAGGQIAIGGTAASDNLVLRSTSNGTKGQVWIDEVTASSSTTTGALRVSGGVGVAGSIFAGPTVSASTQMLAPLFERATSGVLAFGSANAIQVDLGVHANTATGNFLTGSGDKTLNLGTGTGSNIINIGGTNSTVNIIGTLQYIQSTTLEVANPNIILNEAGAAGSGENSGIQINEGGVITGYIQVGNTRGSWDLKAPLSDVNARLMRLTPPGQDFIGELLFATLTADRSFTFPDNSGTVALTSDLSGYLALTGGTLSGTLIMDTQNAVQFNDADSSNWVAIAAPTAVTGNYTIALPATAPGSNTTLTYNGSAYVWAAASSGTVSSGVAGRLGLYPTTSTNIDDVYVQNSQNIDIAVVAQPTRSAPIEYTIPNPGDAVTAASFVLTEGNQTINGIKSHGNNIAASSNNSIDLASDAAEMKDLWAHALKHNDATNPNLAISVLGNNGGIIMLANGTGNIDLSGAKVRQSADGTNFTEVQYLDSLALSANVSSPTEISSSLSFALATYVGATIDYVIKEATSNKTRVGQFIVSNDGTIASSADAYSETATLGSATGLNLSADISGGNVRILYNNTHATNAATMRATIRRFRA